MILALVKQSALQKCLNVLDCFPAQITLSLQLYFILITLTNCQVAEIFKKRKYEFKQRFLLIATVYLVVSQQCKSAKKK